MTTVSSNASSPIKPVKIDSESMTFILQKVIKKYTAIQPRITYFEDMTKCITDHFMTSLIESESSGKDLHSKLKKSKLSRKFEFLNKVEPRSGFLLFFQVGFKKQQAILIHLSHLRSETSEIRLFSKYKDHFDLLPPSLLNFIERIICIYKTKHSSLTHFNPSNKIFLFPKDKQNMTSLQFAIYLVILFLSDRSSPSNFSKEKPLPSLTRFEYWNFCKTVNSIMADCEKRKIDLLPLLPSPESKRNKIDMAQTSSSQNNVKKFKSVQTQTWFLEPTSSLNRKLQQDLHFAHIEIRKLQQENIQLKLSNNHYEPF